MRGRTTKRGAWRTVKQARSHAAIGPYKDNSAQIKANSAQINANTGQNKANSAQINANTGQNGGPSDDYLRVRHFPPKIVTTSQVKND